jgi:hypothetical protein
VFGLLVFGVIYVLPWWMLALVVSAANQERRISLWFIRRMLEPASM